MTVYASFDVSDKVCAVHVVEPGGRAVWHGVCATNPEEMAKALRRRAPDFSTPNISYFTQRSRRGFTHAPLKQTHRPHTRMARCADDDMIVHGDAQFLARVGNIARDHDVRAAWLRVSARVVVDEDD